MTLFFWRKPAHPVALHDNVLVVPSSLDFRADKNVVSQAKGLLSSPVGRLMLSILQNESPMRIGTLRGGATSEDIHRAYGFEEGYRHCLQTLISLGNLAEQPKEPEVTFEDNAQEDMTWKQS